MEKSLCVTYLCRYEVGEIELSALQRERVFLSRQAKSWLKVVKWRSCEDTLNAGYRL